MLEAVAQALLLAGLIIFLFLGSLRRGLVVAVSMPMSFLLTFAGMKLFHIQIDMVTLTAIILAVGMVVDASVVDSRKNKQENIRKKSCRPSKRPSRERGKSSSRFVAGNTTTLLVLVPLLFLSGFTGKNFGPLAATMIIAFLSSLLVALSLVPLLSLPVIGKGRRMERFAAT
jgi:HAE1 family hydrophobic/amphiphilic exporter-1